ncbi:MAG: hypothetical protein ABF289_09565 [Clostridiales bacterium]
MSYKLKNNFLCHIADDLPELKIYIFDTISFNSYIIEEHSARSFLKMFNSEQKDIKNEFLGCDFLEWQNFK